MTRPLILFLMLLFATAVGAQNADAIYEEGKALYDQKNYAEAFPKLSTAAKKGHKKAQYWLGRCYDKGHGVAEDNVAAVNWYNKSAAQGYYKAEYQLARAYVKGKGVTPSDKKARQWVLKAVGGKKHGAEMLEKIRKSAEEGDTTDQRLLELME